MKQIKIIGNPDILIVSSTLGRGTGSGIAPFVVKSAKEKGIKKIVPVVTTPFVFEGKKDLKRQILRLKKSMNLCKILLL